MPTIQLWSQTLPTVVSDLIQRHNFPLCPTPPTSQALLNAFNLTDPWPASSEAQSRACRPAPACTPAITTRMVPLGQLREFEPLKSPNMSGTMWALPDSILKITGCDYSGHMFLCAVASHGELSHSPQSLWLPTLPVSLFSFCTCPWRPQLWDICKVTPSFTPTVLWVWTQFFVPKILPDTRTNAWNCCTPLLSHIPRVSSSTPRNPVLPTPWPDFSP